MFRILEEQSESMAGAARSSFEERVFAHVSHWFAREVAAMGDDRARADIRRGIERAKGYGFDTEMLACQYVDVMFALGLGFDEDPQLPWASWILNDLSCPDPFVRMDSLYKHALVRLTEGRRNGPEGTP